MMFGEIDPLPRRGLPGKKVLRFLIFRHGEDLYWEPNSLWKVQQMTLRAALRSTTTILFFDYDR
eukprot:scaffold9510_cov58-Attheya_sp.AAC.2